MPAPIIARKGTLLIVSGPRRDPDRKHLHVVCTDPDEAGNVVLVPICSVPTGTHDQTCILQPHEHAFVKKPSFLLYARADLYSAKALAAGVRERVIIPDHDINGQSFLRIVSGLCRSKQTPRKIKRYLNCADI